MLYETIEFDNEIFMNLIKTPRKVHNFLELQTYIQTQYNNHINNLTKADLSLKICPHCLQAGLKRHAYYERYFAFGDKSCLIELLRLICKNCHTTHALIPDFIIPYRWPLVKQTQDLISYYLNKDCNAIDNFLNTYAFDISIVKSTYNLFTKTFKHIFKSIDEIKNFSTKQIDQIHLFYNNILKERYPKYITP